MKTTLSSRSRVSLSSPRSVLCGLLALLTIGVAAGPTAGQTIARVADPLTAAHGQTVDSARVWVREWMTMNNLPGVSVAVGIDGELVWAEGFGWADLEQRVPVTPLTRFRIGSASKGLTSAAVGLLHERGVLELDAPVRTYVPGFPEKRWPISTRQLMGHTAGIRHYRDDEGYSSEHYDNVLEALEIFAADSLLFQPGTEYSYSSYGWNLMLDGDLLDRETVELLWTPLRLESGEATGYGLGWFVGEMDGDREVASPGSSAGGMTAFFILPEQRVVISVMSNVTRAEVVPVWIRLARLFMAIPPPAEPPVAEDAPAGLAGLVGFYEGARLGRGITVTLENGTLYGEPTGSQKQPLVLQSGTTYSVGREGSSLGMLSFTLDADGRAMALVLRPGEEGERTFPKVR